MSKQKWPTYVISKGVPQVIYFYPHYTNREVDELAEYLSDSLDYIVPSDGSQTFRIAFSAPPNYTPKGSYFLRADLVTSRSGYGSEYYWSVEYQDPKAGKTFKEDFGGKESDLSRVIRYCVRNFGYDWGKLDNVYNLSDEPYVRLGLR